MLPREILKTLVMKKKNALLQIVNPEKDLNFQHENIQTTVEQMENELLLESGMV